jgi:hypothetical protein
MKQRRSAEGDRKLMMEALVHFSTSATLPSLVAHHPFWTDPLSLVLTFVVKNCYSDCSEKSRTLQDIPKFYCPLYVFSTPESTI